MIHFTVILPSVTRTLDNSNLPLTRTNFPFPCGHFLYYSTLDNSNHACQDETAGQNKQYCSPEHWIYLNRSRLCILCPFLHISNTCQSRPSWQYLVFSCCCALLCFTIRYVLINNLEILFHFHSTSLLLNLFPGLLFSTPDTSNLSFQFPLGGSSYRESTVLGDGRSLEAGNYFKESRELSNCFFITDDQFIQERNLVTVSYF